MPLIISIAHQKGGVGKSTIAANLASYYTQNQLSTAVVDADVQGSIAQLVQTYGDENVYKSIRLIPRSHFESFDELAGRPEDVLIIDTPPYLSTNLNDIFLVSDYVLIPTKTGVFDMFAIEGTLELVEAARKTKPSLKIGVVINMTTASESFRKDIRAHLQAKAADVLDAEIFKRVEFQRSLLSGSIFDSADRKAQKEIIDLGDEILDKLQNV